MAEKDTKIAEDEEVVKIYDDYQIAKKLVQLKQSASSRGLEFNLSFKKVKKLLNTKKCFYTGKAFAESGLQARSIDRVDSNIGYLDSNVVACTSEINSKKTNLNIDEILCIAKKVLQHKNKTK